MAEFFQKLGEKVAILGTPVSDVGWEGMTQLPEIVEHTLQIAWDYLERSGEITNQQESAELLLTNIRLQLLRGERRTIAIANRAIAAHQRH